MRMKPVAIAFMTSLLSSTTYAVETKLPEAPVVLISTTYLPDIIGDFDHFTVDLKRNHLFVSAEAHLKSRFRGPMVNC